MVDSPAISVDALVKRFGVFTAVDQLSFSVARGEIFGLLGPNGSGKTTTINLISGLSEPSGGAVSIFGLDPRRQATAVRRMLGVVPQETALYEELSAWRNLSFHAELFGVPAGERPRRIAAMLELAQLTDRAKDRVSTFSGGMKRRLAIARALLHDPALVYLDEPTLGVDVQARHVIWNYIREMKSQGRTVLVTTNYLEEAEQLCDRLAIIDHGRLMALDAPATLKASYGSTVVELELDTPAPKSLIGFLSALPGVADVQADGAQVKVGLRIADIGPHEEGSGRPVSPGSDRHEAAAALPGILDRVAQAGVRTRRLNLREASLDEVFLALTGRGLRD
ncbi:daunorubicin/doxorubicin resistance ATP-binding protein DrrA [Peptococcaceae bacterium CEB3]|nr:daunorubicin/doxorubicin resistance ATP-binding protein DrrA [Peptococcaceae bacterium CEB3]